MRRLVIATHNPGKVREFRRLFASLRLNLLSLDDCGVESEIEETGATFEANARLKAIGYAKLTGEWTLADDSGIEVDALNGAPGVRSARFSGPNQTDEDRNRFLLDKLRGVPEARRTARYRAVLVLAGPQSSEGKDVHVTEGTCEGRIGHQPVGDGGFGYDPLFVSEQFGRTMAELTPDEKDSISHRGKAARAMVDVLERLTQSNPNSARH